MEGLAHDQRTAHGRAPSDGAQHKKRARLSQSQARPISAPRGRVPKGKS